MVDEVTVKLVKENTSVLHLLKLAPLGFLVFGIFLKNKRRRVLEKETEDKAAKEPDCVKPSFCRKNCCACPPTR